METIFRICLFVSGVINLLPSILAFLPQKINYSYGVEFSNANLELLLRHRAVLFGIIGGIMIFSAVTKKHYNLSVTIGLVSMVSFVLLYFLIGEINAELTKVMKIDIAAILVLIVGFLFYKFK